METFNTFYDITDYREIIFIEMFSNIKENSEISIYVFLQDEFTNNDTIQRLYFPFATYTKYSQQIIQSKSVNKKYKYHIDHAIINYYISHTLDLDNIFENFQLNEEYYCIVLIHPYKYEKIISVKSYNRDQHTLFLEDLKLKYKSKVMNAPKLLLYIQKDNTQFVLHITKNKIQIFATFKNQDQQCIKDVKENINLIYRSICFFSRNK